jgi:hypothetical protein
MRAGLHAPARTGLRGRDESRIVRLKRRVARPVDKWLASHAPASAPSIFRRICSTRPRVALNFDQVQLYAPPGNLAKETVASPQLLKTKEPGFRQDATAVASRRRAGRETRLRFASASTPSTRTEAKSARP